MTVQGEKLLIGFLILSIRQMIAIRVTKNLSSGIKLISKIKHRSISLRDNNGFHKFADEGHSCLDY